MTSLRPITLLIAALGGEGGGVLTGWIVSAAEQAGFPVQSTSIPGVAQRTGATTYYIEIFPALTRELDGKYPVLALTPGVGDIDIAVASELLEAGRTVAGRRRGLRAGQWERPADEPAGMLRHLRWQRERRVQQRRRRGGRGLPPQREALLHLPVHKAVQAVFFRHVAAVYFPTRYLSIADARHL